MATQIRLPQTSFGTGFKNKLTNPKFDLWNRLPLFVDPDLAPGDDFFTVNTGALAAKSVFTADRWIVHMASPNTTPTYIVSKVANATANPNGFPNSLRVQLNVVESATDTTNGIISQKIEASDAAAFELGKPGSTAALSLSFWVKTSVAGTYHICYRNGYYDNTITGSPPISNTRTHVIPFEVLAPNTWEFKEITIPTDTDIPTNWVWHTEEGVGLEIFWVLYAGTDFQTATPNQWNNENKVATSTQSGFETVLGATFEITGCQLELGPHPTSFEHRPISFEADICSNYYQRGTFAESMYGTFTGSFRTNEKFVSFKAFPYNRIPIFNVWIRYGTATGIAPIGTGLDYLFTNTVNQHVYPWPQVFAVYPNALYFQFERHTASADCSFVVHYEVESELYSNE